jgi:hypothetical protein
MIVDTRSFQKAIDLEWQKATTEEVAQCLEQYNVQKTRWVVRAWRLIATEKADEYGPYAWSSNGLRGLYASLSAKHLRIKNIGFEFDACRDIFGYTVLSLVMARRYGLSLEQIIAICKKTSDRVQKGDIDSDWKDVCERIWMNDTVELEDAITSIVQYCYKILQVYALDFQSKVGIVIPTYQRPDLLAKALDSIPDLDYPVYVVYNRGREDDIKINIAHEFIAVCTDGRGAGVMADGAQQAVRDGIEYLVFMNDDVELFPNAIEGLLEPFFMDKNVGVCGVLNGWKDYYDLENTPMVFDRPYTGVCWATPSKLYMESGGIDVEQMVAEDLDYQLRMQIIGKTIVVNQKADAIHHWDSPGGLNESGMWRGNARYFVGRVSACKQINSKIPGIIYLNENMAWVINYDALKMYQDSYRYGKISLSCKGVDWTAGGH